jgi:hypothetical protein
MELGTQAARSWGNDARLAVSYTQLPLVGRQQKKSGSYIDYQNAPLY